jgi:glycosyltransferase involved in cell wall biosynthesis
LKEVAGGAAVVVEGRDPGDYVHALERLDDAEEREDLVQKGWARARQFTWQKTAALTAAVYKPLF